ncbi:MAG: hypothetical protein U1A78_27335 [Polyangia bacterium]
MQAESDRHAVARRGLACRDGINGMILTLLKDQTQHLHDRIERTFDLPSRQGSWLAGGVAC